MINTKVYISLTNYSNMERRSLKFVFVLMYTPINVKLFTFQKKTFNVARYETKHFQGRLGKEKTSSISNGIRAEVRR